MEHQIFCDGIGKISIIEGMVRLDLYSFSPNEIDANGNPRPVLSHRIVLGVDGFLRSSEKVVETVKLISQHRQQQAVPAAAPAPQRPPQPQPQAVAPRPPQPQAASVPQPAPPPPVPQQPAPQQPAPVSPSKPPFP
jgi:hypothetical protein